jgi:hypothetical protein
MEDNKPFLAYLALAVAFIILAGWQAINGISSHSNLKAAYKQRIEVVDRAELAQKNLQNFVEDLIKLSETNEGAKTLVEKYQIHRTGDAAQPQR